MTAIRYILAAIVLLIAATILWLLGREFHDVYQQADAELRLGVLTAIGSGIALLWTGAHQAGRERQSRLFESKREAYAKFFEYLFDIFRAQRKNIPLDQDELVDKFSTFTQNVMSWGSAETINAVNQFQRGNVTIQSGDLPRLFQNTERLLRALRKDLGHNDARLERFGLTKLLLKAEEHDQLGT